MKWHNRHSLSVSFYFLFCLFVFYPLDFVLKTKMIGVALFCSMFCAMDGILSGFHAIEIFRRKCCHI